jgi:hypothetical protein
MAEAMREAEGLAGVMRLTALVALGSCAVVVVVAFLIGGPLAGSLAAGGSLVGVLNLWVAAGALRRVPALFIGTSAPRLLLITVVAAVLLVALGPIALWSLAGLLLTHLLEVAAVLRHGLKQVARS